MVKQGFLNLAPDRQEEILQAAIDEFGKKDFFAASFNEIIKNANISKGSMYHYFKNKEDLYFYILDKVAIKKQKYLVEKLTEMEESLDSLDFFEVLYSQMLISLNFALENPKLQKVMENLQNIEDRVFRKKVMDYLGIELDNYLENMVNDALKKGELRGDLDREFLLRILHFLFLNFGQLFPESYKIKIENREEIKRILEQFLDFLKSGLQPKKNREEQHS